MTQAVQKIKATWEGEEKRIEMGALKINDDWPGLFIRGDSCIDLASRLATARHFMEEYTPKEKQDIQFHLAIAGLKGVFNMITEDVLIQPPSTPRAF